MKSIDERWASADADACGLRVRDNEKRIEEDRRG